MRSTCPGSRFQRASGAILLRITAGSQGVEPVQQVGVASPSRRTARSGRAVHLFEGTPLGLEIRPRVVVRRIEADVPEPTPDHRDVDPGGNQLDARRVATMSLVT